MANLKLYIVTFNCGRALIEPNAFGEHLFDGWQDPTPSGASLPDLIVLNLQEVAPLSYAFTSSNLVKPYFDRFRQAVKRASSKASGQNSDDEYEYSNVLSRNCGLTALMLFVRSDVIDEIASLNLSEVGVGLSEMANKGAIGARVGWKVSGPEDVTYTTFVSAHLAPFEQETERRNKDYLNIVQGLVFPKEGARVRRKSHDAAELVPLLSSDPSDSSRDGTGQGVYTNDSYLFFSGDLNYRTALTGPAKNDFEQFPQPSTDVKSACHYSHLLVKDQLMQQMELGKTLHGMKEQNINFPPTYKYHLSTNEPVLIDDDASEWHWAQHRWPSWCDRILFAEDPSLKVQVGKYAALPLFRTSDHRPVALSVGVPLKPISNSQFADQAPIRLDSRSTSKRDAAKRKEIVVGAGAYLVLTWEGNAVLLGTILFALGATYILKSMT